MTDLYLAHPWLGGTAVSRRPGTPNIGGTYGKGLPDTLVIHYTASTLMAGTVAWFMNPQARASAHLVIDRDGKIVQLVPFDRVAWHAGVSAWGDRTGLNKYSIGIELVNAGVLVGEPGNLKTWYNVTVPDSQAMFAVPRAVAGVEAGKGRWWHRYTQKQIDATRAVARLLIAEMGVKWILGHDEVAPGRKLDPGPALDLDKLRRELDLPL